MWHELMVFPIVLGPASLFYVFHWRTFAQKDD